MRKVIEVKMKLKLKEYNKRVHEQALLGLQDCLDDLVRTSSQCAPHDEGILEKSWTKTIENKNSPKPVGVVTYSVKKKGGKDKKKGLFNYALKMHEEHYKLGKKSQEKASAGGGVGMSGKQYPVGRNYLGGVLKGEEETYKQHIQKLVDEASV
jgi:hypothetical protein